MIKHICDICGKELNDDSSSEYKVKVKKRWYSWHEYGWIHLDLCKTCNDKFFDLVNKDK